MKIQLLRKIKNNPEIYLQDKSNYRTKINIYRKKK